MLRLLLLLVLACVSSGCHLSHQMRLEVIDKVRAVRDTRLSCPADDAARCAAPSQLLDHARAAGRPSVLLLEEGPEALLVRIHAIRAARERIDIQTFIFAEDEVGLLVLDELLSAARRGVKVRLIVDQLFSFGDAELFAELATAHANFEIELYNPTFGRAETTAIEFTAGLLCCFFEINHRMHNKVLVVDDVLGITGGRNYQNRYFDLDPEFNYIDRDVLVVGEAARRMRESVDQFWAHDITVPAEFLLDVSSQITQGGSFGRPDLQAEREVLLSELGPGWPDLDGDWRQRLEPVDEVDFFADPPAKLLDHRRGEQDITAHIRAELAQAEQEVWLQTPYLVMTRRAIRLLKRARREHPELQYYISTNSLASTDAYPVYALSHKKKHVWGEMGAFLYEMKPRPPEHLPQVSPYALVAAQTGQPVPIEADGVRMSMHAKSLVIDGYVTLIGSHNFDPRSEDFNTEVGLLIHDREVAAQVIEQIRSLTTPEAAWVVARSPEVPLLSRLLRLVASVSRKLPIGDIWPYREMTSYELRAGHQPLSPDHPDFQEHYRVVGQFPGVNLSLKAIQTLLISAFGGWAAPIL